MSDARSLLRQQRQARRITHPHAAYSDAGKLLCTVCREPVKAETLWDSHIQSDTHKKRAALLQAQSQQRDVPTPTTETAASTKRKHRDDDGDDNMEPNDDSVEDDSLQPDQARRKRTRPDLPDSDSMKTRTPPPPPTSVMTRRSSGTPSQGVELQMPSRPATPRDSNTSSSSNGSTTHASRQASILVPGPPLKPLGTKSEKDKKQETIDEDEWAAFEADVAAADYAAEATISAPAMTSEETAAAAAKAEAGEDEEDGDPRKRKTQRETDLLDEKEDARRALEEELDEMQSLEAKVTKLRQQREALKQRAASHGETTGTQKKPAFSAPTEKENAAVVEDDEEDESDESDEDDGWDGFRFRTGVASRG